MKLNDRLVGRAVTRSSTEREVGQISGQSSQTVLPTARYCGNIFSKGAMLLGRNDAEMGPQTHYMLQRNTTSMNKNLILI